jgi:hypothetical protein
LTRDPDATALIDPIDRMRVTGREPRRLSYTQADKAIDALAAHFVEMRLPLDGVLGVQLPNTVEFALTMLAAHRAGLAVALLPQLWRHADLTAALNYTGACGLVTMSRIDGVDHAALARRAGAETFSVRYLGAFGDNLPDGMSSLDKAMALPINAAPPHLQDAQRNAAITFDTLADGMRAVPRTHIQVIAGALAIYLEAGLPHGATLMSAVAPSSYAGLTAGFCAWLLTGGTLALHHPFNADTLLRQIQRDNCSGLVVPGSLLPRFADPDTVARTDALHRIVGVWRAPEQVAAAAPWTVETVSVTDLYVFGEAGLFGARRGESGLPAMIRGGPFGAPRNDPNRSAMGETVITPSGTLGMSGPMTVPAAYGAVEFVDTFCPARIDPGTGLLTLDAAPEGVVSVGGYRFPRDHLERWAERLGGDAKLSNAVDDLCGHRLEGQSLSNALARAALAELGLNPLISDAFRDRPQD